MSRFQTEYDEILARMMPHLEAIVKPPEFRDLVMHLLDRFRYLESRLPEYQITINGVRRHCLARLPEGTDHMLDTDQLVELVIRHEKAALSSQLHDANLANEELHWKLDELLKKFRSVRRVAWLTAAAWVVAAGWTLGHIFIR
jgi:hypothetical protein